MYFAELTINKISKSKKLMKSFCNECENKLFFSINMVFKISKTINQNFLKINWFFKNIFFSFQCLLAMMASCALAGTTLIQNPGVVYPHNIGFYSAGVAGVAVPQQQVVAQTYSAPVTYDKNPVAPPAFRVHLGNKVEVKQVPIEQHGYVIKY